MRLCPTLVLALLVLGSACGGADPPGSRDDGEYQAVLQRLDSMERRLDELEDARAAALEDIVPSDDELTSPDSTITLPRAEPSGDESQPLVTVHIDDVGVMVNGLRVTDDEADDRFAEVARTAPETRLVVVAERDVPHEKVVAVLDRAKQAGLQHIAISVRVPGKPTP